MTDNREEAIRARAHQIWEDEGRPEGRNGDHWAQASQEIGAAGDGARAAASIGIDEAPVHTGGASSVGARQDAATGGQPAVTVDKQPAAKANKASGRKPASR